MAPDRCSHTALRRGAEFSAHLVWRLHLDNALGLSKKAVAPVFFSPLQSLNGGPARALQIDTKVGVIENQEHHRRVRMSRYSLPIIAIYTRGNSRSARMRMPFSQPIAGLPGFFPASDRLHPMSFRRATEQSWSGMVPNIWPSRVHQLNGTGFAVPEQ